jgi:hypothetical protein
MARPRGPIPERRRRRLGPCLGLAVLLGWAAGGPVFAQAPVGARLESFATEPAAAGSADAAAPAAEPSDPAFWKLGDYLSRDLPTWLRVSGEYRARPEEKTGFGFVPGDNDEYVLSRLRLNLNIGPASWLHLFVQAQDAEALGMNPANVTSTYKDVFDLRQAYLELRDRENGWFRLRTGRQELRFGTERLVGVSPWTNTTRVFDGMRLTLGSDSARVDVFTASVVVNYPVSFDDHLGGMTFNGVYGSLTRLVPRATVEPYAFWRTANTVTSLEKVAGKESEITAGMRWAGKLPLGFDYTLEGARQSGAYSKDTIDAWGGYAIAGYGLSFLPCHPRLSAEYGYATGQGANSSGKMETFDQLYPSNHGVFGITDLFGWRNVRHFRSGLEIDPGRRLALNFNYHNLRLASRYDGLYSGAGSLIVKAPKGGALSTDVGQEADGYLTYDLRSNVNLGAGLGHLFAGAFLTQNTKGADVTYPYIFLNYQF